MEMTAAHILVVDVARSTTTITLICICVKCHVTVYILVADVVSATYTANGLVVKVQK